MKIKISIPKKCNEHWDKMIPKNNGKFCDKCNLTVVDFTSMTDDEIQKYFVGKSYVCGRFDYSQLNKQSNNGLAAIKDKIENTSFPILKYLILYLLALPLFISSCINRSSKEKTNKINVSKIDTPRHLIGAVVMQKNIKPPSKKNKHP